MAESIPIYTHSWQLGNEAETGALAHELSLLAGAGDWIGLVGDLGVGKTTFVRALIRAYSGTDIEVPSPTFTLMQLYNECRVPVAHLDLYRLTHVSQVDELGSEELAASHLVAIEWAERLGDQLPDDRLMIELHHSGDARTATMTGYGVWRRRLERFVLAGKFVAEHARQYSRRFLQGDASTRRYERLTADDGSSRLLMDMPAKTEPAPPVGGSSYSQSVHLAEDISAVVAINQELLRAGFSAPQVYDVDLANGFAILEDFGDQVFGTLDIYGKDVSEPVQSAVMALAEIASKSWPAEVKIDKRAHKVAPYDVAALSIEAELLMAWFWPMIKPGKAPKTLHDGFVSTWRPLLQLVQEDQPVWVLRDYHSPNLIWLPDREGTSRVGIIDSQDTVRGSAAYDLVSLLQDARIDVHSTVEAQLLDDYANHRRTNDPAFDEDRFRRSYAILGAQRAAKILGIFARLSKRDGKHGYLGHILRVSRSLERNLQHPALSGLKGWFDRHLPSDQRETAGGGAA